MSGEMSTPETFRKNISSKIPLVFSKSDSCPLGYDLNQSRICSFSNTVVNKEECEVNCPYTRENQNA